MGNGYERAHRILAEKKQRGGTTHPLPSEELLSELTNIGSRNIDNHDPEKAGSDIDAAIIKYFETEGCYDVVHMIRSIKRY